MLKPEVYDHPVTRIRLIETHISWVILTGEFAYKIKKSVDFGFLDFSTLEKRRQYCQQELQLNRRLAAELYLDVVCITGSTARPVIAPTAAVPAEKVMDYAVKMKQFPQSAQLDNLLAAGYLHVVQMDQIAQMVAKFHQSIAIADNKTTYGNSDSVQRPVTENFVQIHNTIDVSPYQDTLRQLQAWAESVFIKHKSQFDKRKAGGFVRECHGDMHLSNMLWLDGRAMAFDCIEFNPFFRWIDVISEIAFLVMDLQDRRQPKLANRFLNTYLEQTGDYAGLSVMAYYLCYRAMVRAKVAVLRLAQKSLAKQEKQQTRVEFESYLNLAVSYTRAQQPKLIIMRGLSASGKSTLSQQLIDAGGMIRIRSDVERKRLFNIPLTSHVINNTNNHGVKNKAAVTDSAKINQGLYSKRASEQTYNRLLDLCSAIIHAGYTVIVDAAFLHFERRYPFQQLAAELGVAFCILEITAPVEVLKQRIKQRKHSVSDADITVLNSQLASWQPLHKSESAFSIRINTVEKINVDTLITTLGVCRI